MRYKKILSKRRRSRVKKRISLNKDKLKHWSKLVRTRDSYTCISCKGQEKTHAHHMVSKFYRPNFALLIDNGITLCSKCHIGYGGVHHKKSEPKNPLIKNLRLIFKFNNIKKSIRLGKGLRQDRNNSKKLKPKYQRYLYKKN